MLHICTDPHDAHVWYEQHCAMQQGSSLLLQVTCTTTELTALNSRLASAAAKCLALTEQVSPALCWLTSPALLPLGQAAWYWAVGTAFAVVPRSRLQNCANLAKIRCSLQAETSRPRSSSVQLQTGLLN